MRKTLMTRLIESFNGVVTAMMWHYMAMSKRCGRGMLSRLWA